MGTHLETAEIRINSGLGCSQLPTGSQSPSEVRALRRLEKRLLDRMRHLY